MSAAAETVSVRLVHCGSNLPTKSTPGSAGFDLYAAEETVVPGSRVTAEGGVEIGRAVVPTGLQLAIPPGLYGRVAPRSGLAVRHGLDVGAGVVDSDYREELKVLLFNFGAADYTVAMGDRIAQLVFERIGDPALEVVTRLEKTERTGGFGSTGLR